MADGAAEITKSLREVFGLYGINDGETLRLMCWPHTYRNYSKQLAPIKEINKKLAKDVDNDIQNIQWMVQSEEEFSKVFLLLEEKYLDGDYTEEEIKNGDHLAVMKFAAESKSQRGYSKQKQAVQQSVV